MERKKEKDNFGDVIEFKLPDVKKCPICRREVGSTEIVYIKNCF